VIRSGGLFHSCRKAPHKHRSARYDGPARVRYLPAERACRNDILAAQKYAARQHEQAGQQNPQAWSAEDFKDANGK